MAHLVFLSVILGSIALQFYLMSYYIMSSDLSFSNPSLLHFIFPMIDEHETATAELAPVNDKGSVVNWIEKIHRI